MTVVFIIYNIALIPICFLKLWWHKLIMIYVYSKSYRVSRADKFITFCFFWMIGGVTLIINTVVDIWYFLKHLWLKDLNKTQHKTSHERISKVNLEILSKYFKGIQDKMIPYKNVATDIRGKFGIFETILKILQPHSLITSGDDEIQVS